MTIQVYTHEACLEHRLFPFFAEKPERLQVLRPLFAELALPMAAAGRVSSADLLRAHDPAYVAHVKAISEMGFLRATYNQISAHQVQWYTRISPQSYDAASYSAGLVTQAIDDVRAGRVQRAFCAGRPPGHHAGPDWGEGFCLFSNVGIGALAAVERGLGRVAVIDFDRHHGNGTQAVLTQHGAHPDILFVSSYQAGCKYSTEGQEPVSNIITVPIPVKSSFAAVADLYQRAVLPALDAFKPDLLMFSAGFDLHKSDPLSSVRLEDRDYSDLTSMVKEAAGCSSRNVPVVSVLEGGYNLKALPLCVANHLRALAW